jgi:hypothetical protein
MLNDTVYVKVWFNVDCIINVDNII